MEQRSTGLLAAARRFADVTSTDYVGALLEQGRERAAREMLRVVRKGGRIGLANWTPDSFIGQVFRVIGKHVAPPAGLQSPALWGTQARLSELFPRQDIALTPLVFNFRYRSPEHWVEVFRTYYGPVNRAFAALGADGQAALEADLLALLNRMNRGGEAALIVPSAYVEAVITKG